MSSDLPVRKYRVGVCELDPPKKNGMPRLIAYTRYLLEGQCFHDVEASTGKEAREMAMGEHLRECMKG